MKDEQKLKVSYRQSREKGVTVLTIKLHTHQPQHADHLKKFMNRSRKEVPTFDFTLAELLRS